VLVSEIFAKGIAYWEFAKALEVFAADAGRVRAEFRGEPVPSEAASKPVDSGELSHFVVIRP
jgi:hypothetical protein